MTDRNPADFFPGFAWAVPRAFADPLAACRFELGDTLYSDARAYTGKWEDARRQGRAVQVLEPSRGIGGGGDDSGFAEAWKQEVVFELHDFVGDQTRTVGTTQGRLYTLLWKGDETVLDPESAEPAVPANATAFKKHLEIAATKIPARGEVRYLMATDAAAGLPREKLQKVSIALEEGFGVLPRVIPVTELELDTEFLPTVQLAVFELGQADPGAVTEALQAVLYKPSAGRVTAGSRFRLATHGLLETPGAD